jgi:hypothetical protein
MVSGGNTAVRSIAGLKATISVELAANATVYAVEESIPPGFTADAINEGGNLDAIHNQIKWGPFFDNHTRSFQYTLRVPLGFTGSAEATGIVSIDGEDLLISGDSVFGASAPVEDAQLELEKFAGLVVTGTLGARYRIESSDVLSPAQWMPLETITLTNNPQYWIDDRSPIIQAQRYYRAITVP